VVGLDVTLDVQSSAMLGSSGAKGNLRWKMSIGAQLRTAREAKGLSIDTIAQRTRVKVRALSAIEQDDLSLLPPRPFGRGFVRAYAEEVDLDPDRIVRDYFAQFPSTADSANSYSPPPRFVDRPEPSIDLASHWSGLATAATILLLVVSAAVVLGRRSDTKAEPDAVGTSGSSAQSVTPAKETASVPQAAAKPPADARPSPAPAGASAPLNLAFTIKRPCWVTASADGTRTIYRMLQAGDSESISATNEIQIRFGDASAVAWSLNGKARGPLGGEGVVRDLRVTPQNVASFD
jgi:cytoskeletal protein RodZ